MTDGITPREWLEAAGSIPQSHVDDTGWCQEVRLLLDDGDCAVRVVERVESYRTGLEQLELPVETVKQRAIAALRDGAAVVRKSLGSDSHFLAALVDAIAASLECKSEVARTAFAPLDARRLSDLRVAIVQRNTRAFERDDLTPTRWLAALLGPERQRAVRLGQNQPCDPLRLVGAAARELLGGQQPSAGGCLLLAALVHRPVDETGFEWGALLNALELESNDLRDAFSAMAQHGNASSLRREQVPVDIDAVLNETEFEIAATIERLGFALNLREVEMRRAADKLEEPTDRWPRLTWTLLRSCWPEMEVASQCLQDIAAKRGLRLDWGSPESVQEPELWSRRDHFEVLWGLEALVERTRQMARHELTEMHARATPLGRLRLAAVEAELAMSQGEPSIADLFAQPGTAASWRDAYVRGDDDTAWSPQPSEVPADRVRVLLNLGTTALETVMGTEQAAQLRSHLLERLRSHVLAITPQKHAWLVRTAFKVEYEGAGQSCPRFATALDNGAIGRKLLAGDVSRVEALDAFTLVSLALEARAQGEDVDDVLQGIAHERRTTLLAECRLVDDERQEFEDRVRVLAERVPYLTSSADLDQELQDFLTGTLRMHPQPLDGPFHPPKSAEVPWALRLGVGPAVLAVLMIASALWMAVRYLPGRPVAHAERGSPQESALNGQLQVIETKSEIYILAPPLSHSDYDAYGVPGRSGEFIRVNYYQAREWCETAGEIEVPGKGKFLVRLPRVEDPACASNGSNEPVWLDGDNGPASLEGVASIYSRETPTPQEVPAWERRAFRVVLTRKKSAQ